MLALLTQTRIDDNAINVAKQVVEREDGGHYSHLQRWLDRQDWATPPVISWRWNWASNAERAEVSHLTREQLEKVRKAWYAPNNMTLIVVGELDRLLPAYLERAYGALVAVEPADHLPLPTIQASAAHERTLSHGFVGGGAKLHWLVPEPVQEDQPDETFDLLKDYPTGRFIANCAWSMGCPMGPRPSVRCLAEWAS